jgi:hypothetical protein
MAKVIGTAGASVRQMEAQRRRVRRLTMLGVALLFAVIICIWSATSRRLSGTSALVASVLVIAAMKALDNHATQSDRRRRKRQGDAARGAKGEEKVARILEALPDDYTVIHDLPCPLGNIDHVVVGPGGVFVVETKAHGGRVSIADGLLLLNGKPPEKDFVGQALGNALWLKQSLGDRPGLDVWVEAVLVFSNAFVERGTAVKGVTVTYPGHLARLITTARGRLIPVDEVTEALRARLTPASSATPER